MSIREILRASIFPIAHMSAWVAAGLLSLACSGVVKGPDPIPGQGFRAVSTGSGTNESQVLMNSAPLTALFKISGNYAITARLFPPPYLVIDGDINLVVEPVPGQEAKAQEALTLGHALIRRNGAPGWMNAPGTAASLGR